MKFSPARPSPATGKQGMELDPKLFVRGLFYAIIIPLLATPVKIFIKIKTLPGKLIKKENGKRKQ